LGLANTLQSMGDLERSLGQIEAAQSHYAQAEQLYRQEQDHLGLANTLRGIGDLERSRENYEAACTLYETTVELYQHEQDDVGEAVTLAELCRTYSHTRKKDFAISYLLETIKKFDTFPEYAKSYIANCLKEAITLLDLDSV
jgi:tetratricopeptide (TPR) repeat protein